MAINCLYVSYDGMTDPLGQSQVIPYLIGLTKNGYSTTLISCEKKDNFKKNKIQIQTLLTQNNIDWKPISYTKKPPIFSTLYDIYQLKKLATQLHKNKNFSIVHCRSYIAAFVGLSLKQKYNLKFIFDMRGFWANERIDGKIWNLKNPIFKLVYNYFKRKEIEFLENSDYTISLTSNAKQEILTWPLKNNPINIKVIPCCADLELFNINNIDAAVLQQYKQELKIEENTFVLLYLGSIGTWYMLDEMMAFFSVLKSKKINAKFLFITKDEQEHILNIADKYNCKDDVIIRAGERKEIPYLIALSQFSIFFILPAYSKKASSPTKQGELMAMGIPVVCNTNVGDTDKIVTEYKSGILINEFNNAAYESAIEKMDFAYNITEIIKGATDFFSLENGVQKYAEVYAELIK